MFSSVSKCAFYVSEGLFRFFLWMVLMFFLTSDSGEKTISFEKKFRHFCWNCILSVPRTFWGVFIKNVLVFQFSLVYQAKFIELPAEIIQQSSKKHFEPKLFELWRNFSTESSTCILLVQRNTFRKTICWLCETTSDFGQGNVLFAAEILQPWYQICSFVPRWAIGRIVLKEFLLFLIFFGRPGNMFLVFSVYPSRLDGPNWIPQAKMNISIRKNFVRKLFVLSGLWAHFFEHSFKSFRHVVKTTVYLFTGALSERLSFSKFSNLFSDFDR